LRSTIPDFQRNGTISVFSNDDDPDGTGRLLGGSRIMEVDPSTGRTSVRYGGTPQQKMFSSRRGDHQYLDHGTCSSTRANRAASSR
jgi:hypothetical protein